MNIIFDQGAYWNCDQKLFYPNIDNYVRESDEYAKVTYENYTSFQFED